MRAMRLEQAPPGAPSPQEEQGGQWWGLCGVDGGLLAALHALPALGLGRPRYSFHIGRVVHAAPELGLHQVQTTLQLGHDGTGEAEFSAFYAAPEASDAALDSLLQAALAGLRTDSGAALVLAELPGWRDAQGRSPFWDGLVRHFLPAQGLSLASGIERFGPALTSHLGSMLPRQLIHATFLPEPAQQALGRADEASSRWAAALRRAGFADWRHCRIDDGGPLLARPLAQRSL